MATPAGASGPLGAIADAAGAPVVLEFAGDGFNLTPWKRKGTRKGGKPGSDNRVLVKRLEVPAWFIVFLMANYGPKGPGGSGVGIDPGAGVIQTPASDLLRWLWDNTGLGALTGVKSAP